MKLSDLIPGSQEARLIGGVVAACLLVALVIACVLGVRSCAAAPAEERAAQATVNETVVNGFAEAAQQATAITGNTMDQSAEIDRQTETNHDAIQHATGATQGVDPAVSLAGLRALCMRRAYSNQPRCVALLHPGAEPAKH